MHKLQHTDILTHHPIDTLIDGLIKFCKVNQYSFATWKNPNSNVINLMVDFSSGLSIDSINLETSPSGFVFSPYDPQKDKLFLKKDLFVQWGDSTKIDYENSTLTDSLLSFLENETIETDKTLTFSNLPEDGVSFKSLVALSIDKIKSGIFTKVVPSRHRKIKFNSQQSFGNHFVQLTNTYTNAFVSIVYTPTTNIWIGATPELLISTEGDLFKTVALAATQIYDSSKILADVAWTQKEIEEQALVSRYIINNFKKIRLREYQENGPKTIKAGNLIHLKTEYLVNMRETNFPELGSTMLNLLHPTSAVCGMPLESSYAFLQQHEGYDREYYSGYLGPVNIDESTNLYVNLRCMKVEENEITLFAGAGVTEDSNPEKEWSETEMKMNTLLNVISN
ncbi:MAG TPA: isochorismate synthase [Fulvivirga sp.]|nr:isochorismate synthase [Fulvivirga sp.]